MPDEGIKRRLAAILSADVAGYTRLMSEDEVETLQRLKTYRELIRVRVEEHHGRIVDSPGDNILAEFPSALDATRCAVDIQRVLKDRNADLSADRRMDFRIGIHLGDVMVDGERIYGDGVNIAARMEELSEIGGICISDSVHTQVKGKLDVGYDDIGKQLVKNIAEPIQAFAVIFPSSIEDASISKSRTTRKSIPAIAVAIVLIVGLVAVWNYVLRSKIPLEKANISEVGAVSLSEKPSIAVLPFDNMSGNPEYEYLADSLTDAVIAGLSTIKSLFVIARNSTFIYKGTPISVRKVGKELNVDYILEGSFQRFENQLRLTIQLIESAKGTHLLSKVYNRDLGDLFAIQDDITKKVMVALQVELTHGEQARAWERGTDNVEAYISLLQGYANYERMTEEGFSVAMQFAQEAIELDPEYSAAYALMGGMYGMLLWFRSESSTAGFYDKAYEYAQKALEINNQDPDARALLGFLYMLKGEYDKGVAECEKAITINPNLANSYAYFGNMLMYAGMYEKAIAQFSKSIRLNPYPPGWYYIGLAWANWIIGRYEETVALCKKIISDTRRPDAPYPHVTLAVAYLSMGREKDAQAEAKTALKLDPEFAIDSSFGGLPYRDQKVRERIINCMQKAGLK